MTNKEYQRKLQKLKAKNRQIEMKRNLRKEYLKTLPQIKKPSTSKIILFAVLLINLQIVYFVEKAIMQYGDLSALYALIAIPATLIPTVWSYYSKSTKENCANGIVYETAMAQLNKEKESEIQDDGILTDCSDE